MQKSSAVLGLTCRVVQFGILAEDSDGSAYEQSAGSATFPYRKVKGMIRSTYHPLRHRKCPEACGGSGRRDRLSRRCGGTR